MANPFLSIIIPAYNEESRLPDTLQQVTNFLDAQTYPAEVLVVENGSHDLTADVTEAFASDHPRVRLIRENRVIGDYALDSLKREKNDAREVREGYECGIKLAGFNDIKEGDVMEVYKIEEIARTF